MRFIKVLPHKRFQPRRRPARRGIDATEAGSRKPEVAVGFAAGDSLTKEARRLLTALAQPETWAIIDPTDPASVLVHRRRSGISVGAGRFASAVADALVRQD